MGILSGMLLVAGIAFFGKKKSSNNGTCTEKNKNSTTTDTNELNKSIKKTPTPEESNCIANEDSIKK